jgi:methyl-accepting chemotaxis protein/methyl-accepting chemotaxis protein-1 (serine sensor receptor)
MNSTMTIGRRFILTAGILVLLVAIMASIAISGFNGIGKEVNAMMADSFPGVIYGTAMNYDAAEIRVCQLRYLMATNAEDMQRIAEEIDKDRQDFKQAMKNYEPSAVQEEDKQNLAKLKAFVESIDDSWPKVVHLRNSNKMDEANKVYSDEVRPELLSISSLLKDIVAMNKKAAEDSTARIGGTIKSAWSFTLITAIVAFVVGIGLAWIMISTLNRQMAQVVSELTEGAEQIASAASQVSSSSQSLAQGSSEQAASIEETSASSEEINSMARKNTDNSRTMASLMNQSQGMFVKTNSQLGEMVVSMDEINESSGKISKIIKVIDEIAFQTNILALNAAVEAARAGEAGMGFAVVADEVRSLAQRSAQAAKDTALLIEESISKSNAGKDKVDQVATAIQSITTDSAKIKTLVDEVSLGSEEQSRGLEQIARSITQMEQVTQTTAANAEESAAAAEELNAQSEALRDVVHRLNAMVGGADQGLSEGRVPALRARVSNLAKQSARAAVASLPVAARPKVSAEDKKAFPLENAFHEF